MLEGEIEKEASGYGLNDINRVHIFVRFDVFVDSGVLGHQRCYQGSLHGSGFCQSPGYGLPCMNREDESYIGDRAVVFKVYH